MLISAAMGNDDLALRAAHVFETTAKLDLVPPL
jgi:hypothetical protein